MAERQPHHNPEPQRAPHEGGNGVLGIPPTLNERAKPPPERQQPPSVWDVLERRMRVQERHSSLEKLHGRHMHEELKKLWRDELEVRRLEEALEDRGTARDNLICDLFYRTQPVLSLSREGFQQFRARTEALSEEEITEELRKRLEAIGERTPPPTGATLFSGVGIFDLIGTRNKKPS